MNPQNIEKRMQEVIDFNKTLDSVPRAVEKMSPVAKQQVAERVAKRRRELGLDS